MTLTFRGHQYETTTTLALEPTETQLLGQYRGNLVTFTPARSATPTNVVLSYRGIRYTR